MTASSFRLRSVRIHGHDVTYRMSGEGPTVVLIHGIAGSSTTWRAVMPALAERYTVIAPDLLGHGQSAKPRGDYSLGAYASGIRDLLAVLGQERSTVVGHSLGGGVAMQFAYQYPDRCERLVLVSSGGVSRAVHPILRLASTPGAELVLPLLRLKSARMLGHALFTLLSALGTDIGLDAADMVRVFDALPAVTARRAFVRTLRAVVDQRGQVITMLDRCYLTRGMPTLLIWGRHDAIIPYEHAQLAHTAMPGSRLETFEDAGHFPHHANPTRFLHVLYDFLATTKPTPYSPGEWRELLRRGRISGVDQDCVQRTDEALANSMLSGT